MESSCTIVMVLLHSIINNSPCFVITVVFDSLTATKK